MAIREIIRMGHPVLRQKARSVEDDEIKSPDLCRLVDDMIETLDDAGGIGLAAPQVNESVRVAILNMPEGANRYGNFEAIPLTVCINPKMTISAETQLEGYWEGCLSVPGLRGFRETSAIVTVKLYRHGRNRPGDRVQRIPCYRLPA